MSDVLTATDTPEAPPEPVAAPEPFEPIVSPFLALGLPETLTRTLTELGYEIPTPIQDATIPALLAGRDVIGQAQTGTGKTAAFALPMLASLAPKSHLPQVLILAPTRELALQVSEAVEQYARHLPGVRVLAVYGGTGYGDQLRELSRGPQIIVGTPGRVLDHMARGTLDLSGLRMLVLDEADEMLRMGFIDDVEAVLKAAPADRQIALFSATMPPPIRRLAQSYLRNPQEITMAGRTTTAPTIRARGWITGGGMDKFDALMRLLEGEPFDAMLVFVRTRIAADELCEALSNRGFKAAALHGDIHQRDRERVVEALRDGRVPIVVATDVAARGLDVERITHVLNFDLPTDVESYVHRIGRTGRAGRRGEAILFATPRERSMLNVIERGTRTIIERLVLPSTEIINASRIAKFQERVAQVVAASSVNMKTFREQVAQLSKDANLDMVEIAAALACLAHGEAPMLLPPDRTPPAPYSEAAPPPRPRTRDSVSDFDRPANFDRPERAPERTVDRAPERAPERASSTDRGPKPAQGAPQQWRIEVGFRHGVEPRNIVGALANEAGIPSRYIGRLEIRDFYSLIELPADLPAHIADAMKRTWVAKRQLRGTPWDPGAPIAGPVESASSDLPPESRSPKRRKVL